MFSITPVTFYCHALFALELILEDETSDFQDLGRLLLGGFILAVVAGVAFTFIRLRLRDKKPPPAQFISIDFPKRKMKT
jgi:hypothetical protein